MKKRFAIFMTCFLFIGLFLVGCGATYNELDSKAYEENPDRYTINKVYTILDVREMFGINDGFDYSYISLVLLDEDNGEREYYCYGSDKDDIYINIAKLVPGDTVIYHGNSKFELLEISDGTK